MAPNNNQELYNYRAYLGMKIWQKAIIALIIFVVFAVFLDFLNIRLDLFSFFSASALFFSIIFGFFLASALGNLSRLKTLVAQEVGTLITLHDFIKIINREMAQKVADAIDHYIIARFDWELENYVENTEKEFSNIFDALESKQVEAKDTRETQALYFAFNSELLITQIRKEIAIVTKSTLTRFYWLLLYLLGAIVVISLFISADKNLIGLVSTVLLSIAVAVALLVLDEVDKNKLNENDFAFSPYNTVLEAIGKLPYFLEVDFKAKRIFTPDNKNYRLGIYKNFPYSFEKEIKIVNP